MASFISHSRRWIPWLTVKLLATAILAWGCAAFYSIRLNPEMVFLRHGHQLKQAWLNQLEQKNQPKTVIYGGSSCLTSVDPVRMLEHYDVRALNLGFHAGMGATILTHYTLPYLKPGDTLIVALEPSLLVHPQEIQPLGVQFCFATGRYDALPDSEGSHWIGSLLALRPGSQNVFTFLGKIVLRRPLHRYSRAEILRGGWQAVAERRDFSCPPPDSVQLSDDARHLLQSIRTYCMEKGVRVGYSLPWSYSPPERVSYCQNQNRILMRQIAEVLPVLEDPRFGIYSVREHFADTCLHLTAQGAMVKTDELAEQIKNWKVISRSLPENTVH